VIERADDKAKEEYAVGNDELRRSFERIQKEYQPTEVEDDEIDWGFLLFSSCSSQTGLWNKLVVSPPTLAATSPLDLQRALLAGIPAPLRGTIWQILSASKNGDLEQVYTNVLLATASPQEKLIRKDIARTFPKQDYFRIREGSTGQEGLFNVCKAYSLYDPEVNYMQGMAFIVGPLLLNVMPRRLLLTSDARAGGFLYACAIDEGLFTAAVIFARDARPSSSLVSV
jgi:ecotropic viral integration site 5 protein